MCGSSWRRCPCHQVAPRIFLRFGTGEKSHRLPLGNQRWHRKSLINAGVQVKIIHIIYIYIYTVNICKWGVFNCHVWLLKGSEGYTSWPEYNHELYNILKLIKTDHVWASWWGSMTLPQSHRLNATSTKPGFTAAQLYFRSTELPSIFGLTSSTGSGATPMGGKNDEKAWGCHHPTMGIMVMQRTCGFGWKQGTSQNQDINMI